ncbi:glycosyltransferase [Leucobacter sp. UT-8R-CII-1-4]|uniref:glycosyltransferase n=1 Tax=Leucobacter sp. UT-8R-CII-1-4 TaxID=3040075 RepID=UPI0024A986B4|nr:glycosyltransferase [Leucobacter sp. UT-8R-CII-1-4]MDI6023867.1 glycosyltransferase [Leucobacter sp. UT-8R-CII-1-4]
MAQKTAQFPSAKHYALTWGITDSYGGMTGALLHRSRAFRNLAGVNVEVLTLDDRADYAALGERLRERGELIDGLSIRNLWDDLRTRKIAAPKSEAAPIEGADRLSAEASDRVLERHGVVILRQRLDEAGAVIASDRYRDDGTLLETERGKGDKYRVVLYSPSGQAIKQWTSRWKLYRWWLDRVFAKKLSYLIVDSKTSARFIPGYRRENVVTMHLVHASHRDESGKPSLRASRAEVLKRCGDFDAVIVLTERQRAELLSDLVELNVEMNGRIRVIPNSIHLPDDATDAGHVRGRGIMLATLDARKRVADAIDAVGLAKRSAPDLELHVYGQGAKAGALQARVNKKRLQDVITLHGFQPTARQRFTDADFSLLASESEGMGLVLVESMAVGCIPIAYDVRYGPGDIIRSGVDGFLVPDGDVKAMAERILEVQQMPLDQLSAMRRRAIARAQAFSDEAIVRLWANEMHDAFDAKMMRAVADGPLMLRLRRRAGVLKRRALRALNS